MSRTYSEVMQEIKSLQAEAERIRQEEITEVIGRIKKAIDAYGITAADLGFRRPGPKPGVKAAKAGKGKSSKVSSPAPAKAAVVKYRDGQNTWVGRGPRPLWLREALRAGKSLQDFAV